MAEKIQVCFGGFGGQGIVLMGTVLGWAAVREGLWAAGSNSYGAQARGSACKAEVLLSPEPVDFPRVIKADLLVALSQEAYDRFLPLLGEDGLVIHDAPGVLPRHERGPLHIPIQGTRLALERLGNAQAANMVFLGVVAGLTGLVSLEALAEAMEENVPPRFCELNRKALEEGFFQGLAARQRVPQDRIGCLQLVGTR